MPERERAINRLINHALVDEEFRMLLLTQPEATLNEYEELHPRDREVLGRFRATSFEALAQTVDDYLRGVLPPELTTAWDYAQDPGRWTA